MSILRLLKSKPKILLRLKQLKGNTISINKFITLFDTLKQLIYKELNITAEEYAENQSYLHELIDKEYENNQQVLLLKKQLKDKQHEYQQILNNNQAKIDRLNQHINQIKLTFQQKKIILLIT